MGNVGLEGGAATFAEYAETWMTEYVEIANRLTTVKEKRSALRSHLLPAFGGLKLCEITTSIVDAKVAVWMRSGMSAKRANNLLTILRRSLRCAVEWGLLPQAPIIRHHRYFPPVPKFLTREESWRLVNSMEPGFWRTFVLFLLGTGVRFGEAAALRWEDLDLDSKFPTVTIRRAVALGVVAEPKTRASRPMRTAGRVSRDASIGSALLLSFSTMASSSTNGPRAARCPMTRSAC